MPATVTDTSGKVMKQASDYMIRLTMQKWHTETYHIDHFCVWAHHDSRSQDNVPKHRNNVYVCTILSDIYHI